MDRTHTWLCVNSFLNSDNSSRRTTTKDVLYFSLSKRNIESYFQSLAVAEKLQHFSFPFINQPRNPYSINEYVFISVRASLERASPSECVAVNLLISFLFLIPNARHIHPGIVALLVFCPSPRDIITLRQREYSRSVCMYSVKDALWICTV